MVALRHGPENKHDELHSTRCYDRFRHRVVAAIQAIEWGALAIYATSPCRPKGQNQDRIDSSNPTIGPLSGSSDPMEASGAGAALATLHFDPSIDVGSEIDAEVQW